MASTDPSEWILLDSDLTSKLSILPAGKSHLYFELNEPGSGELSVPLDSNAASVITSGMFAQNNYRGDSRGGFFVDNIGITHVDAAEEGGRWMSISGRGAMALLEDAIVWGNGTSETTREFAAASQASILITLLTEAQARGGLAALTWDFSASVDSDSAAWTDSEPYTLTVGTSLLDVVRQIARSGTDFDVAYSAGSFVLSAYKNGAGTDKSNTVYFRTGVDCEEIKSDERGDGIQNALLVKYRDGFISVSDAVSIAARRRREKLLNVGTAQSSSSATTIGSAEVALRKDPKKNISLKIYDGKGPRAFVDYILGDYITLDIEGVETRYRILGIQCDYEGGTYSNIVIDLNSLLYDNEQRMARDIDWLMDQWSTARDSNLIEVSYWAAIGNDDFAFDAGTINSFGRFLSMHKIGDVIYFAETNTGRITSYSITSGQWELITAALTYPHCMTSIGTDLYIGGYGAWKIDTTTNTLTTIGIVLPSSSPVGRILAAAVIGTDVYFGGAFSDIDSVASVNFIRYNSVADTWHACGSGATGRINAMLAFGSDVYLGGSGLTAIDGVAVSFVGKWNGTTGVALGAGLGDDVYTLVAYGTNVLAGGAFTGGISEWNGTSWATLGGGTAGAVHGLSVYLTDVYAIGNFTDLGNYIARYSGSTWWELGTGLNNYAADIVLNDDDVYVVGIFTTAGDKDALYVAAYFNNFEALVDYLENSSSSFNMGAAIHAATASAITDSDEVPFWEDVSNALRKITWANIKATLKTYFDTLYVALTGNQTIAGVKTFSSDPIIPDEAYDATAWNGSLEPPTKNAVRDKVESLVPGSDTQVIVNNAGAFGADDEFNYTLGGQVVTLGRKALAEASHVFQWNAPGVDGVSFHNIASWGTGVYSSMRGILARGTKASPTAVQADDVLMRYRGSGYDGTGLVLSTGTHAEIKIVANQNFTGSAHGARLEFWTTPDGSTTEAKVLSIGANGALTLTPGTPADGLDFMTFASDRPWTIQQSGSGAAAVLEFLSSFAGKYVQINPADNSAGGLIVGNATPGTLERLVVIGTGNIKAMVETLSSTGYAFNRLKNDTGQLFDFGLNGSARTGTIFGLNNSTAGVGLSYMSAVSGPLAVGTFGSYDLSLATSNVVRLIVTSGGNILSTAGGIGYTTGAGGTVTQATNKATGVTLNKVTGLITMNNAALAADTTVTFTLTNSAIAATDTVILNHASAGTAGAYTLNAQVAAGSATINVRNVTAGSLSEAIVIRYTVIKSVSA